MPASWTSIECEAAVAAYFVMLECELRGQSYNKAESRRVLLAKLNGRSESSIEYKHQNISAILLRAGHAYIPGYKPAWNYQALLEQVVLDRIGAHRNWVLEIEDEQIAQVPITREVLDWKALFVTPPEIRHRQQVREPRTPGSRKIDYAEREIRNRLLGERGEEFVLDVERKRLTSIGRKDLIGDIEWTSKQSGDGSGYDIRSFRGTTDDELFIEVKTTNSGIEQPFLITSNEVDFSERNPESYALYRVFEFKKAPSIYSLEGRISEHVFLDATQFRGSFRP